MRAFLDAGGNFIDTAAVYGDGDSERVIGGLAGSLFKREEIVLATKAGITFPDGIRTVNNSRAALMAELDNSLARLGTDYVDLWQIHTWDSENPISDALSALDWAYNSGRARYVGISNFSGWQTAHCVTRQSNQGGKAPITSIQSEYSLLNREVEREIIPAAQALGFGFLPWSPLGRGVLTGKYRNGLPSDSRGASPHFAGFVEPYLDARSSRIVEAVCVAADGLGFSPLEVSLAWVRDAPGVTSAIVGARTGAQLRGILTSEQISLPEVVREALSEVSAIL
jgi:aryl-alcohol dehydrogenase-like predicted oxidoreductase